MSPEIVLKLSVAGTPKSSMVSETFNLLASCLTVIEGLEIETLLTSKSRSSHGRVNEETLAGYSTTKCR